VDIFLETPRLILRRFTMDDLDDVFALDGDPEVMAFLTGGRGTPRAELESVHLPAWIADYGRDGGRFGYWAAQLRETGTFIGWFDLRPGKDDPPGEAELGYRLRRDAWGKGYASEGARALVDKAFTDLGLDRVRAETMTVNTGSRRVMEKAGLRYVRTFFADWPDTIPGGEHGDVEYALTRQGWERQEWERRGSACDAPPDLEP
jgi:RimJ/RimL family protein N-acetyltransferase